MLTRESRTIKKEIEHIGKMEQEKWLQKYHKKGSRENVKVGNMDLRVIEYLKTLLLIIEGQNRRLITGLK